MEWAFLLSRVRLCRVAGLWVFGRSDVGVGQGLERLSTAAVVLDEDLILEEILGHLFLHLRLEPVELSGGEVLQLVDVVAAAEEVSFGVVGLAPTDVASTRYPGLSSLVFVALLPTTLVPKSGRTCNFGAVSLPVIFILDHIFDRHKAPEDSTKVRHFMLAVELPLPVFPALYGRRHKLLIASVRLS